MAYQRLGLAALVVGAIRSAVADPEVQAQVDEQAQALASVRAGFDSLNERLEALSGKVAAGETLDADQAEELAGIKGELNDLATALVGPAEDDSDNGVIAEVEPVIDTTSPAADAIVEAEAPAPEGGGGTGGTEQTEG